MKSRRSPLENRSLAQLIALAILLFSALQEARCAGLGQPISTYCFDTPYELGRDCTGINHASVVGVAPEPVTDGIMPNAVTFDASSYLLIPTSPSLTFKDGFAISFWASLPVFSSQAFIYPVRRGHQFSRDCAPPPTQIGWTFWNGVGFSTMPGYQTVLQASAAGYDPYSDCITIGESEYDGINQPWAWVKYVWTASATNGIGRLYRNGVLVNEYDSFGVLSLASFNSAALEIGRMNLGSISDVRVYGNYATAAQVASDWADENPMLPIIGDSTPAKCIFGGSCKRPTSSGAHTGHDFMAQPGTSVVSICDGVVDRIRYDPEFWNQLIRVHLTGSNCGPMRGKWAYYGHIDPAPRVNRDTNIARGAVLGTVMSWGENSHLHFAIKNDAVTADWGYLDTKKVTDPNCRKKSMMTRRDAIEKKGFVDIGALAAQMGWNLPKLESGSDCVYPEGQAYVQEPYGTSVPYSPFIDR